MCTLSVTQSGACWSCAALHRMTTHGTAAARCAGPRRFAKRAAPSAHRRALCKPARGRTGTSTAGGGAAHLVNDRRAASRSPAAVTTAAPGAMSARRGCHRRWPSSQASSTSGSAGERRARSCVDRRARAGVHTDGRARRTSAEVRPQRARARSSQLVPPPRRAMPRLGSPSS